MNVKPIRLLLALILVAILGGGLFWYFQSPVEDESGPSAEELAELTRWKNTGIAYLENKEYAAAAAEFQKVIARLPDDETSIRNLAIARVLPLVDDATAISREVDPAAFAEAEAAATAAMEQLRAVAPRSAVTHLLQGELFAAQRRYQDAFDSLQQATAAAPDDPALWYATYKICEQSRDPELEMLGYRALVQAYRITDGRNLWVLLDRLQAEVQNVDRLQPETNVLETALQAVQPYAEQIEAVRRFDVVQALQRAMESLQAGERQAVVANVLPVINCMRPEIAVKIDGRRIDKNLLEYVLYDFGESVDAVQTVPDDADPIPVRFTPFTETEFPSLAEVRDLQVADFDLDGQLDLIVLQPDRIRVLSREGDANAWRDTLEFALEGDFVGLCCGDLDRDYQRIAEDRALTDVDLLVYGPAGAVLLQNQQPADAPQRSLLPMEQNADWQGLDGVRTAILVDFDHDGDLDPVLATSKGLALFRNREDWTFEDVSARSILPPEEFRTSDIELVDWNRDLAIDLLLASKETRECGVMENILHGRLRWQPFTEIQPGVRTGCLDIDVLDADANASWDLITVGEDGAAVLLTSTPESGRVRTLDQKSVSETPTRIVSLLDLDNDALRDAILWTETGAVVLRGAPGAVFHTDDAVLADPPEPVEVCRVADLDQDGDLDLAVVAGGRVQLFDNEGGNRNSWLKVELQAEENPEQFPSQRVNMAGIGSLLEIKNGNAYQARTVTDAVTHFGLGSSSQADVVRVVWTDGVPQNVVDVASQLRLHTKQLLKGSCPYLYTWTGERFEFLTDCLWAAPIGLQFAEGVQATPREWEYLRIPGERLVPRQGEYVLQLTEELWEAAYFDHVRLIAIDHPGEFQVYSNEKVGPGEIAEFRLHTVHERRAPRSVRTADGRDLMPELASADRRFAAAFTRRIKQGLTDLHYLELDLGPLEPDQRVTLFLTGWVFPTDTSLNIAISQNPAVAAPQPPSLWAPAAGTAEAGERDDSESAADAGELNRHWRRVVPYIGFPGGKTKTIAVDLTGKFRAEDPRVRIVTSMELYWDQVFLTVDEPGGTLRKTPLALLGADLHDRGFSRRAPGQNLGPESYLYDEVQSESPWAPMYGRLTRYGDVTELIASSDDRLVVMGAGDEMTVRFQVPETPVPAGWQRDFILYNVGWDKDADLNTIAGQSTEPLPFRTMTGYPPREPPQNDAYQKYLKVWQTRRQPATPFWRQILQWTPRDEP